MRCVSLIMLAVLFGLTIPAQAESSASGDRHYRPFNLKKLQKEVVELQDGKLTQQEIHSFAAHIHNVSILNSSEAEPIILPASARPQGNLKLNSVLEGK